MDTKNEHTQEERLLAALAHASIVAGGIGVIAAIVIYVTQKEKSAYVAFQSLQATIYQLVGFFGIVLLWICWTGFYFLTLIPLMNNPEQYENAPPPIFWIGLCSMACPMMIMGVWWFYGLYGALRAWMGADFRYLVIGNLVEDRLQTAG